MKIRSVMTAILATALLGSCAWLAEEDEDDDPRPWDTGIRGVVVRGPIQPVCQEGEPCDDEPFAATFLVTLAGRPVRSFETGSDGRFEVLLAAGDYQVVPGPDAPLLDPQSQVKDVSVREGAFTEVTLHFDTGIR